MKRIRHFLFGCSGHVDREIDAFGIEWIGLRCATCGKLNPKALSVVQCTEAGRQAVNAEFEGMSS